MEKMLERKNRMLLSENVVRNSIDDDPGSVCQ